MNQSQRDKQAARQPRSRKASPQHEGCSEEYLEDIEPIFTETVENFLERFVTPALKKRGWGLHSYGVIDFKGEEGALVAVELRAKAGQKIRLGGRKYIVLDRDVKEDLDFWVTPKMEEEYFEGSIQLDVDDFSDWSWFADCPTDEIRSLYYKPHSFDPTARGIEKLFAAFDSHWIRRSGVRSKIKKASGVSIAEVERFVKRLRTYMEPDGSSSQGMNLTTRENGDVGDEQPGRADFAEAQRVGRAVLKEFGEDAVSVDVDHIDEWVTLSISLNHSTRKATSASRVASRFKRANDKAAVMTKASAARVALRFAARSGPPSITGSAALLKKQGLTPVDVFFGEARPHRRPIIGLNDMVQDRRGDLMYFAGIASDGSAILGKTEQEAKRLNKQVIEDRKHYSTRAASTNTQRDFYKASDGQWYVDNEGYEEDEYGEQIEGDTTSYGPFSSFEAADKYMSRNFANSGGSTEDDSGRDKPPHKPVSPRGRRWAFSGFSGSTAEGDFYDNPEKKEVLEFAQTGAISNSPEVAAAASEEDHLDISKAVAVAEAEEAPPTPTEIKEEPGGKTLSTLNRLVVDSVDPDAAKAAENNKSRMAAWFGAGLLRDYTTILGSKDKVSSGYYQVVVEKWNEGLRKFEPASNKDSVSEALSHFDIRHSPRDIEAISKSHGIWLVPLGIHSQELVGFGGLELGRRGNPYRLIAEMP